MNGTLDAPSCAISQAASLLEGFHDSTEPSGGSYFLSALHPAHRNASDDGPYFVSERTDIGEPNGDNAVDASMAYAWAADGDAANYNDSASPGAASRYFMCDVADMTGP